MTIDEAQNTLSAAAWNVGDVFVTVQGKGFWQAYAFRGEQRIVANAPSQLDAWLELVRAVESQRRLINAVNLARVAGVSKGAIKHASIAGLFPMVGWDKAHVALFDRDDPRLREWLKAIERDGRLESNDA